MSRKERVSLVDEEIISNDDDDYDTVNIEEEPLATVYSCGWTEDGRCGYSMLESMQLCPRPMDLSKVSEGTEILPEHYVCETAACGDRHTILLLKDCRKLNLTYLNSLEDIDSKVMDAAKIRLHQRRGLRSKRICVVGLNQQGLCEEPGVPLPEEGALSWEAQPKDVPVAVFAGNGTSFILTKRGRLYSFGNGLHGALGLGDCEAQAIPKQILSLSKVFVTKVSTGERHSMCMSNRKEVFTWGHNNVGQLGIGSTADYCSQPTRVNLRAGVVPIGISCGNNFSVCLVLTVNETNGAELNELHGWGAADRGQLGPETMCIGMTAVPVENNSLTRFVKKERLVVTQVCAGGEHCMVLCDPAGRVISWGAADYGQLGHGYVWDDAEPRFVNGLSDVFMLSAGKRHSMALRRVPGEQKITEVYSWGYNGYGELGLGDENIRLQPCRLRGDIDSAELRSISCGARHSIIVTGAVPKRVKDHPLLAPYFKIIEKDPENESLQLLLRKDLKSKAMDPNMLDKGSTAMPNQTGSTLAPLKNDIYEKGLRYCMDTLSDPADWRRKVFETCFECPRFGLTSICLTCARLCKGKFALRAKVRMRKKGDVCDCNRAGICQCRYTVARAAFDRICNDDLCIGPKKLRMLLQSLRAPLFVESADMEVCLLALAGGATEDSDEPRIKALDFEEWYHNYFQ